jgi:hypothetical protein
MSDKPTSADEAGDLLFRVAGPFCVEVMDADFIYSATCTKQLREYARSCGYELTDIVINCIVESELDHQAATKATEYQDFEIRRVGQRVIGVYQSKTTIRSNS